MYLGHKLDQLHILLLEDDVDAAASLAEALRCLDSGYEIRCVTELKQAEAAVLNNGLQVALIDLTLPDADGCDAAIALRKVAPDLPLVALTGRHFDAVALELMHHGVQDFLQKGTTSVQRIHEVLQLAIERHRQEAEVRRLASFDSLTGVMNRSELERQLEKAISLARRGTYRGAVAIIDIDDFKLINDTHGHGAGDAVLQEIAGRLARVARAGDSLGRLGGDEFLLILVGLKSREDAAAAVRKASNITKYAFQRSGCSIDVTTSIGVATFPEQGDTSASLLELADQAMYRAKRMGKNGFRFYTPPDQTDDGHDE